MITPQFTQILFVAAIAVGFSANAVPANKVQATLIADAEAIEPGGALRIGVLLRLPDRAHIYWRNPGDSGLATGIEWHAPEDVDVDELQWPNPKRFQIEGLDDVNYGYENETLIFSNVTFESDTAETDSLTIAARVFWLLCLDDGECIPEEVELTITIPINNEARRSDDTERFETYTDRVPKPLSEFQGELQCSVVKPYLWINLRPPLQAIGSFGGEEAIFFPEVGPSWERILPTLEVGSPKAAFHRDGPDPPDAGGMHALPKGVLTLPVGDPRTNEVLIKYIAFNE